MCSLRFENNLLTIEGVRFASISKKTPLSKLSFAFVSLALPLLVPYIKFFFTDSLCYLLTVAAASCHSTERRFILWTQKLNPAPSVSLRTFELSMRWIEEGDHRSKDTSITLIDILVRTPGSSLLIPSLDVLASFIFFINNPLSNRLCYFACSIINIMYEITVLPET
jgi:hypothetical protein